MVASFSLFKRKENPMKHQKNTHTRKIIACMLCLVMVATLLPVAAFASGSCSYRCMRKVYNQENNQPLRDATRSALLLQ